MAIKDFVVSKTQAKDDTQAFTLKLPNGLVGDIDELAIKLSVSRQELLLEFAEAGFEEATRALEEVSGEQEVQTGYHILNTNKRNNIKDHITMVEAGIAAAYYDKWKLNINKIKKGDVVFLYESGAGIVGYGIGTEEVEIRDKDGNPGEEYRQVLKEYKRVKPFSSSEIRKVTNSKMVFLKTMFSISKDHAFCIIDHLKNK